MYNFSYSETLRRGIQVAETVALRRLIYASKPQGHNEALGFWVLGFRVLGFKVLGFGARF